MYNQMLRAFTRTSPMLIDSQLAKVTKVTKSVTPQTKVIVLDTTENKSAQIVKMFIPHLNISGVPFLPTVRKSAIRDNPTQQTNRSEKPIHN
ncbi:MAG: hypothetical protein HC862_08850 [Scytonema sp. RU_4_4]|nr:hypothetical protein [Scytonema sp. RU_4_4]